jgi:acetate kinase
MAAAVEGIDTLIFAGGIGEHCAEIRARICTPLAFLGVVLDPNRNVLDAGLISSDESSVAVRVLHTDEQRMLAEEARLFLSQAEFSRRGAPVP